MKNFIILIVMTIGCVFSADLPAAAQRELDSFNAAVAKADAERQAKVDKAVDTAVKALDAVSRKAATAEDRRAIDDKILEIKKARSVDDLLGDGKKVNPWVGRYLNGDGSPWIEVSADGTAKLLTNAKVGTWAEENKKLKLRWTGTDWVDTLEHVKDDQYRQTKTNGSVAEIRKDKP